MTVLLIIATAGAFLLGFFVMRRLDDFIERGGILDSPQGRANLGVLIYGAPDIAQRIHKIGMSYKVLTVPDFPENGLYSALFALSRDDCGNLEICCAARRADPGITIVARCHSPQLRGAFEAIGVSRLLSAEESLDPLLAELWGVNR